MDSERMLRCEFAKAAMQAFIGNLGHNKGRLQKHRIARASFDMADEMIMVERALYGRPGVGKETNWPPPPDPPAKLDHPKVPPPPCLTEKFIASAKAAEQRGR